MAEMKLLDLFSGAGGAAVGYRRAGFEVIGVDINPQRHYPYEFMQHDAMELLNDLADYGPEFVLGDAFGEISAIHASPPCQFYSQSTAYHRQKGYKYPDLVGPVRELLLEIGLPYVIENVPEAPLQNPVTLCGFQFGLSVELHGRRFGLIRHRGFETGNGFSLPSLPEPEHDLPAISVHGHGAHGEFYKRWGHGYGADTWRELMGIDWMNRDEIGEAIPPAYAEYAGAYLCSYLCEKQEVAA